jgi:ligand-binding sensor domain-containing protein
MRRQFLLLSLVFFPGAMFSQSFTNYTNASTSGKLPGDFISTIAADSKGNVWIGTDQGVTKSDGTNWTTYTTDSGLIDNHVKVIKEDTQGNLWIAASDPDLEYGGVSRFDGEHWENFDDNQGLVSNFVNEIITDPAGNMYFGSICLWYDMIFVSRYGGVAKFDGLEWTTIIKRERYAFSELALDDEGYLWIGNFYVLDILVDTILPSYSVLKIKPSDTTVYNSENGLPGRWISSIAIDHQGNKWIGTDEGVCMFDGEKWITYTTRDGLANNLVHAMAIDSVGNIWFGTHNGVSKFDGNNWTTYSIEDGLIDNKVISVAIDSKGNKWFATYHGVSRLTDNITAIKPLADPYDARLYPDPVADKLNIEVSKPAAHAGIALFNLDGVQLFSADINSTATQIDMRGFASGIYFVRITIPGEAVLTKQVIKQ